MFWETPRYSGKCNAMALHTSPCEVFWALWKFWVRFCLQSHQKTLELDTIGFSNSFSEELIENYLVPTGNITIGCSYM